MEEEKKILINYLSQNGFSKVSAELYVNSLLKNPEEPTDLKFNFILKLIRFTRCFPSEINLIVRKEDKLLMGAFYDANDAAKYMDGSSNMVVKKIEVI